MRPTGPIIMDINMQYIRAQCGRALAVGKELEFGPSGSIGVRDGPQKVELVPRMWGRRPRSLCGGPDSIVEVRVWNSGKEGEGKGGREGDALEAQTMVRQS